MRSVVLRLRYQVRGGHVHCRLFVAHPPGETFAKSGDLVFALEEWAAVCLCLEGAAIEIVPDTETERV